MWKHSSLIRTKMAEEEDVLNKRVFELRKEVQTLRDTEAKVGHMDKQELMLNTICFVLHYY